MNLIHIPQMLLSAALLYGDTGCNLASVLYSKRPFLPLPPRAYHAPDIGAAPRTSVKPDEREHDGDRQHRQGEGVHRVAPSVEVGRAGRPLSITR
jgi:hypothetical protein